MVARWDKSVRARVLGEGSATLHNGFEREKSLPRCSDIHRPVLLIMRLDSDSRTDVVPVPVWVRLFPLDVCGGNHCDYVQNTDAATVGMRRKPAATKRL